MPRVVVVPPRGEARLGLSLRSQGVVTRGHARVAAVAPGSVAAAALASGDVIIAVNGADTPCFLDAVRALHLASSTEPLLVTLRDAAPDVAAPHAVDAAPRPGIALPMILTTEPDGKQRKPTLADVASVFSSAGAANRGRGLASPTFLRRLGIKPAATPARLEDAASASASHAATPTSGDAASTRSRSPTPSLGVGDDLLGVPTGDSTDCSEYDSDQNAGDGNTPRMLSLLFIYLFFLRYLRWACRGVRQAVAAIA